LLNTAFSPPDQGNLPDHMGSCVTHPTAMLTVALEQKAQPVTFSVWRAKPVASPEQDI